MDTVLAFQGSNLTTTLTPLLETLSNKCLQKGGYGLNGALRESCGHIGAKQEKACKFRGLK